MIAEQKEKNVYLELADKPLLTLKEFCIYLGIGQTKARELIKSKDCTFSLKIGNRFKSFEETICHDIDGI